MKLPRMAKLQMEASRAAELATRYRRLAAKAQRRLERAAAALERERDKWRRSGKCPHCKGTGEVSS